MIDPLELNRVYNVDALEFLKTLPNECVNCVVTSPPYFGLRDYGVEGQIDLEETPEAYVAKLVEVFHEARRVLRSDGTFWLNLGDSYVGATSEYAEGGSAGKNARVSKKTLSGLPNEARGSRNRALYAAGLPMKSLLGIPWRTAFALQADGWILRSEIIWSKPNAMPESVKDRPTKAHETIFLLTKCPDYWYDAEAVKEDTVDGDPRPPAGSKGVLGGPNKRRRSVMRKEFRGGGTYTQNGAWNNPAIKPNRTPGNKPNLLEKRNKRTVWTVSTRGFKGAHFATFPPKLIEPMIRAGCPMGGVVLDPFFGAGTTGYVAQKLGRNWLGSEINPTYIALAEKRLAVPFMISMFETL